MKKMSKILILVLTSCFLFNTFSPLTSYAYDKYSSKYSSLEKQIIKVLYNGKGGKVSCGFDSYQTTSGRHEGIDFSLKSGAPIYSVLDGEVIRVNNSNSLSTLAIYNKSLDITVLYLHGNFSVKTGSISKGTLVGKEDKRGAGSSPHTHIEIRKGKHSYASKSVNDYTLDNPEPFPYWEKILEINTKPSTPSITSGTAVSSSSIKIAWGAVSGATKYRVDRRRSDESSYKTLTSSSTSTSYTDSGLAAGKTYYYRVYAINSAGTSNRSVTYEVHTKPATPNQPSVEKVSDTSLKISWDKVSGATKYKLEYRKATDSSFKTITSSLTGTSYTHTGLAAGTKYVYRVTAIQEGNIGPEGSRKTTNYTSDASSGKTHFTKLSRPSNVLNDNNDKYVDLSWKAANGDRTYVYDVYRDGTKIASRLSGTTYTDKGATSGTIHAYQVKVLDKNDNYNCITYSDTFYAGCKIEKDITVTPESTTSIKITWSKPSSKTGLKYVVKRKSGDSYVDVATVTDTSYTDKNLTKGNTYTYYIQVRDTNNNYLTSTNTKSAVLDITPNKITLNKSSASLTEGDSLNLTATIEPSNSFDKSVTWSSSDTSVAAVSSSGAVTAKSAGSANITAKTSNGKTAVCKITVKSAVCSHSYGDWIIDTKASCETDGSRHRVCSKCGGTESEPIPATGHSYSDEWTIIKEATCTEEGEKAHVCTVCGAQTDNTAIEVTEHSFGEWTSDTVADCSTPREETRTCSVCGKIETQTTGAIDHEYVITNETQPTLDAPGTRTYTCSVCGHTYSEEWVETIEAGTISIGGASPKAGETITVPISISENPGLAGFEFVVNYDKTVLTPTEVTQDILTSSGTFASSIESDETDFNQLKVTWFDANDITEDGVLFNVTFTVDSEAAEGSYAIWLDGVLSNDEMSDVVPDVLGNIITIADVIMGDINQDRRVNASDSVLLSKYLVASSDNQAAMFTANQRKAANLYNSAVDEITIKDGIRLSQLIAGYDLSEAETQAVSLMSTDCANITVESFEAIPGEYIYVPVTISDNPGIAGFNVKLTYDKEYLTPVSVTSDDIIADGNFVSNVDEDSDNSELDSIMAYWNDSDNMYEDGTLFIVEFFVNENAQIGQSIPIEISYDSDEISDMYLNSVDTEVTQGEIDIVEYYEEEIEVEMPPYDIVNISMTSSDGTTYEEIPINGDFNLNVELQSTIEEIIPAVVLAAVYDENGCLIGIRSEEITEELLLSEGIFELYIEPCNKEIADLKVFVWNSFDGMEPLADTILLSN